MRHADNMQRSAFSAIDELLFSQRIVNTVSPDELHHGYQRHRHPALVFLELIVRSVQFVTSWHMLCIDVVLC